MDDERLKQIRHFCKDYFDEMLERVREMRLSERRLYQKIAEIIYTEADATQVYMGLKTWKDAPKGKILKSDISIAKNYLNKEHIKALQRIVTAYLDLAETRAANHTVINMKDWEKFLVQFLQLADYPLLTNKGKTTMLEAKLKAESEFEKYRPMQDKFYISDFDEEIKRLKNKN